jgi:succinyl-CoA synthetase beta subunit
VAAAKALPGPVYVVKSQIHAGGREKGKFKELPADAKGGVRLAKSIEEVAAFAREMLGNTLVTAQTGPAGKQVNRLYIEDGCDIAKEFYLSMLVDRETPIRDISGALTRRSASIPTRCTGIPK